jgi:hypothetical protein
MTMMSRPSARANAGISLVSSLHEGWDVKWFVLSASPIVSGGASVRCWVRGWRVSQLRLRHLTCGRAVPAPECLMHEA